MKKNKSKLKSQSTDKKQRKKLESTLIEKFKTIVDQLGKTKKTEKIIERFSKRLAKKLSSRIKQDPVVVKERKTAPVKKEETKVAKPITVKGVAKKPKALVKPKIESESK